MALTAVILRLATASVAWRIMVVCVYRKLQGLKENKKEEEVVTHEGMLTSIVVKVVNWIAVNVCAIICG